MTPTSDQLKDLLAKVTQGEWVAANEFRSDLCGGTMHIWIGPSDWRSRVARVVEYAGDERANRSNATIIAMAPTLAAEVVRLREALADIVRQKKSNEFCCIRDYRNADFEGGYDECVTVARQALDGTSEK